MHSHRYDTHSVQKSVNNQPSILGRTVPVNAPPLFQDYANNPLQNSFLSQSSISPRQVSRNRRNSNLNSTVFAKDKKPNMNESQNFNRDSPKIKMISQEAKRFKPISNGQDTLNQNPATAYNKCRLKMLKTSVQHDNRGGINTITLPQITQRVAKKERPEKVMTAAGPLSPQEGLMRRKLKLKTLK